MATAKNTSVSSFIPTTGESAAARRTTSAIVTPATASIERTAAKAIRRVSAIPQPSSLAMTRSTGRAVG